MTAHAPRYSPLAMAAFELGFLRWRSGRLRPALVQDLPAHLPGDRPLLLVANHTSWWDGFLLRDLHRTLRPRAHLLTVITARAVERHPFLRRIGGVPVDPASPASVRRMLRGIAAYCRARPDCTITFFPQGSIAPSWAPTQHFRRGIDLLIDALGHCCLLPVALHIEPLNHAAPTPFVCAAPPLFAPEDRPDSVRLRQLIEERLTLIRTRIAAFGEAAPLHSHQDA